MATEQDYRLEPRDDELSQVVCRHCGTPIGEVATASQTPTARHTGRSEADITTESLQIIGEHLRNCVNRDQAADPAQLQDELAGNPPRKTGPRKASVGNRV